MRLHDTFLLPVKIPQKYYLSFPICIVEFLSPRSTHLRLNPAGVYGGEAGEAAGHVREVALVLENVLGLGADPRHLGAVSEVGLVAHQEGEGEQGRHRGRLLRSDTGDGRSYES